MSLLWNQPPPQQPTNTFTWATVTGTAPLRIRLDGETTALPITPQSLINPTSLAANNRVWVQLYGRRVLILGRSGG